MIHRKNVCTETVASPAHWPAVKGWLTKPQQLAFALGPDKAITDTGDG